MWAAQAWTADSFLYGNEGNDTLYGMYGNLADGGGALTFVGGAGKDQIDAGWW